jgi:hypothetical protein
MPIEKRNQLYTYFETGDIPTADQFTNLIDSQINQQDDGISVTKQKDGTNSIGIENKSGTARLNISGDNETGSLVSLYQTSKATDFWLLQDTTRFSGERSGDTGSGTRYLESTLLSSESLEASRSVLLGGLNLTQNSQRFRESRLFIQSDGKVGLGSTRPTRKLQLDESSPNNLTGIRFTNTASLSYGWSTGHAHDSNEIKDGSFMIFEEGDETGKLAGAERLTVLRGGNVGINEAYPDTTLHVTRPVSDHNMPIDLREGTAIAVFGPMEENLALDSSGLQSRKGQLTDKGWFLGANTMNIQPLGGAILIHGDDGQLKTQRVIITEEGSFGIGTTAPVERIDIDGAIKIGTTENTAPVEGTIRWSGADFQGFDGSEWKSFTEGSQVWLEGEDSGTLYYNVDGTKVGIGTDSPSSTLHVVTESDLTIAGSSSDSIAASIQNTSYTNGSGISDVRVGLRIDCDAPWSTNHGPTNIGLYVADVTGQTYSNENFAAVLNGNVVIGDLTGAHLVGESGANVLAIQNGAAPTTPPDPSNTSGGIQLYSAVAGTDDTSIFHVMNGDGKVVTLYEGTALSTALDTTLSATTYGTAEKDAILNLRTRVSELEALLKSFGLLPE